MIFTIEGSQGNAIYPLELHFILRHNTLPEQLCFIVLM